MDKNLFDLYTDYLLASFGQTTATGLSQLVGGQISHDKITRMLASEKLTAKDWWRMIKAEVRKVQEPTAVLAFDDSIEEKPYTDENDIIGWHYDHSKGRTVKGINFLTAHYVTSVACLPITFQIVAKTEPYLDKHGKQKRRSPVSKNEHFRTLVTQCVKNRVPMRYVLADLWFASAENIVAKTEPYLDKHGKQKRRSPVSKNEHFRTLVTQCVKNRVPMRYVLADLWFASAENMRYLKLDLQLDFIFGLKVNRKVALSLADKQAGQYTRIDELPLSEGTPTTVHLEQVPFALQLVKQVFTNKDGSIGVRYLISSDLTLDFVAFTTIYQKRWKVEEYHRSLKQNASLAQSPTRTETTQTNHFVAAMWAWCKLELLCVRQPTNHYQLKAQMYLAALQASFKQLMTIQFPEPAPAA